MSNPFAPFCPECGQQRIQLPSVGYGPGTFGCANPQCPSCHPTVLAQRVEKLEFIVNNLRVSVERLIAEAADKEAKP